MHNLLNRAFYSILTELYYLRNRKTALFKSNATYYQKIYRQFGRTLKVPESFVMPVWNVSAKESEKYFLSSLNDRFLQDFPARESMFISWGGARQKKELDFLETFYPERKLRTLIGESAVGAPKITNLSYLASHNSIHQLTHLTHLKKTLGVDLSSQKTVVEWGGGYGCMARIYFQNFSTTYVIVDLPIFSFLQAVYLSTALSRSKVNLICSKNDKIMVNKINLVPLTTSNLKRLSRLKSDLFISTWAISESTEEAKKFVAENNFFGSSFLLVAYQPANESFPHAANFSKYVLGYKKRLRERIPFIKGENYYLVCSK